MTNIEYMFREFIKEHQPKLVTMAIGMAVLFSVGFVITGDLSQAFGFAHRR